MNKYVMKFFIEKLSENNTKWLRIGTSYSSFDNAKSHVEFWHNDSCQVRIVMEMVPVSNKNFAWAMERMKEGKIVTRQNHGESFRIRKDQKNGNDILVLAGKQDQKCLNLMHDTIMAKDWVLADEENKKTYQ